MCVCTHTARAHVQSAQNKAGLEMGLLSSLEHPPYSHNSTGLFL